MILDEIICFRREQLEREKADVSLSKMKELAENCVKPIYDFAKALKGERLKLICEVKKASPSKGIISEHFEPLKAAMEYERAGAAAISCLTEERYFKGSNEYLDKISRQVKIPVLRKDFVIDAYQIFHARVLGASAVLLIAAALDDRTMSEFLHIVHSLNMKALVEVHDEEELNRALALDPEIIGINNRNLKTFKVSLDTTGRLIENIPKDKVIVSESGIKSNEDMRALRRMGADAVLIGETLMRSENIKATVMSLTEGV